MKRIENIEFKPPYPRGREL